MERSLAFIKRWQMCSTGFRTTRSQSFVLVQTLFFCFFLVFLTDKACNGKSDLFTNFSVGYIFPCTLNGNIP